MKLARHHGTSKAGPNGEHMHIVFYFFWVPFPLVFDVFFLEKVFLTQFLRKSGFRTRCFKFLVNCLSVLIESAYVPEMTKMFVF